MYYKIMDDNINREKKQLDELNKFIPITYPYSLYFTNNNKTI